jgi:hypothetical protein
MSNTPLLLIYEKYKNKEMLFVMYEGDGSDESSQEYCWVTEISFSSQDTIFLNFNNVLLKDSDFLSGQPPPINTIRFAPGLWSPSLGMA